LIRDDRIKEVVKNENYNIPENATVISGKGKYVIPGFADMHVHFGSGGLESGENTTVGYVLQQFLYYGVTTVFSVGGSGGNAKSIRDIRSRAASGTIQAPQVFATGSMLTLPGSHPVATIMTIPPDADPETYDWSSRGVNLVKTIEEARAAVRKNAEAGMDAIKIIVESGPTPFGDDHPQMSPEMITAIVDEASSRNMPVVAHVSSLDELVISVNSGVHAIMHAAGEPVPGPEHWAEMKKNHVFYVPTLSLYAAVISNYWTRPGALEDPFLRAGVASETLNSLEKWHSEAAAMPDSVRQLWWNELLTSISDAHNAGVTIALGTDVNNPFVFPGYSVHAELEFLVEAGLTPMEALITATRHPAEMMGKENDFGTIEPGKRADLLILEANPLENIRNTRTIDTVIAGGTIIDRSNLISD